ncbi:MBL fold metallo-hydrolase [Aeromicrobium endophyticum]|uniref:MBL fold metallo-hydrolase n=1 Tax=Aeromicrobium endophyticum TaxID=2292704 RepID=A0A371PC59_9ACTN|nr:MBL fold metallo-hydrolase [Aeromicrobium endophyticum]REK72990.1 MBL fold metallo-hydrolase [Aeromicrobium endophyticum]
MRVHHLSCGSFAPPLVGHLVCHVLLCETDDGLVLVDTGLGLDDYADPKGRMGPSRHLLKPVMDPAASAVLQLQTRGFSATDVTHVVLTHLDFDHVGGLSDFPQATVHTTADEHAAAITSPDVLDRRRYRPAQWAHGPAWQLHAGRGDAWRAGLTGHEVLPGITLVPMAGHSRGHAAVAVDAGDGRLTIHAGDAAFDASSYADSTPAGHGLQSIRALRAFEQVVGRDRAAIARNHRALRELDAEPGVTVVTAHDPRVFDDVRG